MVRRALAIACAVASGFVGSGCGSDTDPVVVPDPGASATTTTAPVAATGPFGSTTVSMPPAGRGLLTAVRTGVHAPEGFVRVTFEFADTAVPGYRIGHVERPVVQDGSGDEVALAGTAAILVHLMPASSFDLDTSTPTYAGAKRIAISSEAVPEVVFVGDFEAVLEWAIALDEERAFRVSTLDAPPRLVVDVGLEG